MTDKITKEKGKIVRPVLKGAVFAAELCLLADVGCALGGHPLPVAAVLAGWLLLTAGYAAAARALGSTGRLPVLILTALLVLGGAAAGALWLDFSRNAVYENAAADSMGTESADSGFFTGRSVLVIVPHQDDDLNMMGGVLERFVAGGSTVNVLFTTNGDFESGSAEIRLNEAVRVLGSIGIPEENVLFLGYGNSWSGDIHLYNAPENEIMGSRAGFTAVYGLPEHPAWNEGAPYTAAGFLSDLKDVLLTLCPELIFCCDCDSHEDHVACSLFFDKAVGQLRKEHPEFAPRIYKGFAYGTAYYAEKDFYRLNIRSSVPPFDSLSISPQGAFRWADRVRLPVAPETLSRSLRSCDAYRKLGMYASQSARFMAEGIINGDRVFWERDCSGIAYAAKASASSGDADRLNDFMLCDTEDIGNRKDIFYAGTWIPSAEDPDKTAVLTLAEPVELSRIVLYENPSAEDNILDAELTLFPAEDEAPFRFRTGPLDADGHAADLSRQLAESGAAGVKLRAVSVKLLETEGEKAGLNELELYAESAPEASVTAGADRGDLAFVKFTDEEENFVYDYVLSAEEGVFSLYGYRCSSSPEEYELRCVDRKTGEERPVTVENGRIRVTCRRGEELLLSAEKKMPENGAAPEETDGSASAVADYVIIRGANGRTRLGQQLEAFAVHQYPRLQQTACYSLIRAAWHLLGGGTVIL